VARLTPLLSQEASHLGGFFDPLTRELTARVAACRERAEAIEAPQRDVASQKAPWSAPLFFKGIDSRWKHEFVTSCILSISKNVSEKISTTDICNALIAAEAVRFRGPSRSQTNPEPCEKALASGTEPQAVWAMVKLQCRTEGCSNVKDFFVKEFLLGGYRNWETSLGGLNLSAMLQTAPTFTFLMELYQRCLTNLSRAEVDAILQPILINDRATFFKDTFSGVVPLPPELKDAGAVTAPVIASLAARIAPMSDCPPPVREHLALKYIPIAREVFAADFLPLTRPRLGPVPLLLSAIATASTGFPELHLHSPGDRALPFYGNSVALARAIRQGYSVKDMRGYLGLFQKEKTAFADVLKDLDELCAAVGGALGQLASSTWGGGGMFTVPSNSSRAALRDLALSPLQYTHAQACAESAWVFESMLKVRPTEAFKALNSCIADAKHSNADIVPRDFGAVAAALLTCALDSSPKADLSPGLAWTRFSAKAVAGRAQFESVVAYFASTGRAENEADGGVEACEALVMAKSDRVAVVRAVCGGGGEEELDSAEIAAEGCGVEAADIVARVGVLEGGIVAESVTKALALLCAAGEGRGGLIEILSRSEAYLRGAQSTQCGARLFAAMAKEGVALPTDEEVFILRLCNTWY
jgi:hypothetical protein